MDTVAYFQGWLWQCKYLKSPSDRLTPLATIGVGYVGTQHMVSMMMSLVMGITSKGIFMVGLPSYEYY